ncbi:MAG TPA: hypothetical protein GXX20_07220 [Clostridiaceae bacterium]|nr:hypothetical protein [Clostridiaceae bacterium]
MYFIIHTETVEDILPIENIIALEIYNHICEYKTNSGDARTHYDMLLKHGKRLYCVATDDNHTVESSCGGWTMIKAKNLTYEEIISAIEQGHFYASTGPEIYEYYVLDDKLCIECSPVKKIHVKSNTIGHVQSIMAGENEYFTHYEFDFSNLKDLPYFRFEIVDDRGKQAFTNPYYLQNT